MESGLRVTWARVSHPLGLCFPQYLPSRVAERMKYTLSPGALCFLRNDRCFLYALISDNGLSRARDPTNYTGNQHQFWYPSGNIEPAILGFLHTSYRCRNAYFWIRTRCQKNLKICKNIKTRMISQLLSRCFSPWRKGDWCVRKKA